MKILNMITNLAQDEVFIQLCRRRESQLWVRWDFPVKYFSSVEISSRKLIECCKNWTGQGRKVVRWRVQFTEYI